MGAIQFPKLANLARIFGGFEIDLFASNINTKCSPFILWFLDPEAESVDAFTRSSENDYFYAFPPFALALRTLKKIKTDKAEGVVVLPLWPSQPWFPLFN